MKKLKVLLLLISVATLGAIAQTVPHKPTATKIITKQVVDIGCGECRFKMKGKNCDLAVKINGQPYFVDGKGIDDFGDAHAEHGFCNSISKAVVTGEIVNNRFKATEINLLPNKVSKKH